MKKLLLSFVLLVSIAGVSAQDLQKSVFGIHAGTTISNINMSAEGLTVGMTSKFGFQVGASYEALLSKRSPLYFETGVYFTQKGASMDAEGVTVKINLSQILVPVMLNYQVNLGQGVAFVPFAGLYYSVGVGGVQSVGDAAGTSYDEADSYGVSSGNNRSEVGLRVGAGINFDRVVLKVGYEHGFTSIIKKIDSSVEASAKSSAFTVTLGYRF